MRRPRRRQTQATAGAPVLPAEPRRGLAASIAQRRVLSVLSHPKAAPVVAAVLTAVVVAVIIGVALGAALVTAARGADE